MTSNLLSAQPADLALRRALERQVAALVPVDAELQSAATHPPLAPPDWHGPASRAYDGLMVRLRTRLSVAERAVAGALQTSRHALADLES